MLTNADIDQMIYRSDWAGFGYIGERDNALHGGKATLVAKADAMVLDRVNGYGITAEDLFAWANSKRGRWYGDCWFGCNGQHASRYLPTEFGDLA